MVEQATRFTGTGLNHFSFDSEEFYASPYRDFGYEDEDQDQEHFQPIRKFFQLVEVYSSTLRTPDLSIDFDTIPLLALDLAIHSPNLEPLRLSFHEMHENLSELESLIKNRLAFPKGAPASQLKALTWHLDGVEWEDWNSESLIRWIGTSLESFQLSYGLISHSHVVPVTSLSSILASNSSLKFLILFHLSI